MKTSKMMRVSRRDFFKGLLMTMLSVLLLGAYDMLNGGDIPTTWVQWKPLVSTGLASGLAYIIKNFFTNSEDKFLIPEPKK